MKINKWIIAVTIGCLFCVVGICLLTGSPGATLLTIGVAILVLTGVSAIPID